MSLLGKLNSLDEFCEDIGEFLVNGNSICCFIAFSPIYLDEAEIYKIQLEYQIFHDYSVEECTVSLKSVPNPFERIGESMRYKLTGYLDDKFFIVGNILFQDEYLLAEYSFLEGKLMTLIVDRLDVSIISTA